MKDAKLTSIKLNSQTACPPHTADAVTGQRDHNATGTGALVQYPQPNIQMTYIGTPGGDGGDQYTGLDRFNRVIDVRWMNSSSADINRFKYTFSEASNRLTRQNTVAPSGGFDEQYIYDGIYEVSTRKRGTLSGGVITGTPVEEEDFTYDPTGNWPGYVIKENGTTTLNQTRTAQKANQITAITPSGSTGYDGNGNMTTVPEVDVWGTAQTVTYDAWNRPMTVVQGGSTLGTYQYDGLNRRIWKQSLEGGTLTTRHFYYSNKWQVLEERTGTSTTADRQYVWGTRYQDDLVLRDRFVGTADRYYSLADYFQPTAIANTSGVVMERYVYRAFGDVSYYNGSFGSIASSAYAWTYLYGTYLLDLETNLYQVRYRYYHSALGRWLSRDPLPDAELSQGNNLYWYVNNNAMNAVDPSGLFIGEVLEQLLDAAVEGITNAETQCPIENPCQEPCLACCKAASGAAFAAALAALSIGAVLCADFIIPQAVAACLAIDTIIYAGAVARIVIIGHECNSNCMKLPG